jgi:hypothetical protein
MPRRKGYAVRMERPSGGRWTVTVRACTPTEAKAEAESRTAASGGRALYARVV